MKTTAEEIIAERRNAKLPVPGRIDTLMSTTPGLTGQMFTNNLLDSLGGSYQWLSEPLERNDDAAVPTLKAVVSMLATKDKSLTDDAGGDKGKAGAKTAMDKFIEDFPRKKAKWKKIILDDNAMGKRGWDTVEKLWQQASTDKMYRDIDKARFAAMNGLDPETGEIIHPLDWIAGKLGGVFTPRSQRANEEGRDATASELLMDFLQNAAYAVPMAGAEAAAARAVANPLASKVLGATVGAALAPAAIATADYALGTQPYSGPLDAVVDAGIGTAANLGVGKVLAPIIGQLATLGNARGRIPQYIIDFLDGSKFERTKARDIISEAEQALKKHANETNLQYATKLRRGSTPDRLTDQQAIDYEDIIAVRDFARNAENKQAFADAWKNGMEADNYGGYRPLRDPTRPRIEWDDLMCVQRRKKPLDKMVEKALPGSNLGEDLSGGTYANYLEKFGGRRERQVARALVKHPELISLFDDRTLKQILNDPELLFDMGRTWAINKAGNDVASSRVLSRYGIDVANLRKWQDEERKKAGIRTTVSTILDADERAKDRAIAETQSASSMGQSSASSAMPSQVLGTGEPAQLSEQSRKFLGQIAVDPTIMIYGHPDPEQREEFKTWLLTEGHSLLSGTPAARPTWDVE